MAEPRTFPLADVLSVTTPRLLSDRAADGLTDLLNFMTSDELELWQLPRAADEAGPWLVEQHPFLADLQPPVGCDTATLRQWLDDAVGEHGALLAVTALADWVHQDPVQEFVDRLELAQLGTTPTPRDLRVTAHAAILARAVAALDGLWDTTRAVTVLRDAGVPVGDGDRAGDKQARGALRTLRDAGVLVRVDSPPGTAVYRRVEGSGT